MPRVDRNRFTEIITRHLNKNVGNVSTLDAQLDADVRVMIDSLDKAWSPFKATMAVVMAKVAYPEWDTRNHQKQLGGLFSLRTIDHKIISNELHRLGYYETDVSYAMTRAFERVERYTEEYSGILQPKEAKASFLRICARVNDAYDCEECDTILSLLFTKLKERRTSLDALVESCGALVIKSTPSNTLRSLLDKIDTLCKLGAGASVVPELIVQSICMLSRQTLKMKDLKFHRTPDNTSGALCDIEGYDCDNKCVLAIEVKSNISITNNMVITFDKKTKDIPCRYMLTTKPNTKCRVSDQDIVISSVNDFCATELMRARQEYPDIVRDMYTMVRKTVVATPCLMVDLKQQCIDILDADT